MKTPEKVEPLSIKKIEPIIFINLKSYEIDNISKSIKDIGYEPLIVRPKGNGKYQVCSHLEIFQSLKQLGSKEINCIVREMKEQQGKEIAKRISSFMNADGGLVLIGVKDNEPDGLIFKQEDEERITNICRDRINPPQPIHLGICQLNRKTILIIEIVPSREPVQVNGKYYIRAGSTTRPMTPEEIKKKYEDVQKIYKIIKKKDADEIINQKQKYREIFLDETQKKKQYLTLDSSSGPIIGSSCNIYGKLYESFDKKSKLIFTTLYNVTIEELTKILAQYYKIFEGFSYSTSSFSIEQSGFNWIGFGPKDFIKTIEDQNKRYVSIRRKYGEDVHIHHRESAFFIDEIKDGLFFISCEPNFVKDPKELTIDYFDVGFVLKGQPFSQLFNEFFKNIDIEPITILSNDDKLTLGKKEELLVSTKNIEIKMDIPFQANGLIQYIRPEKVPKDDHIWISGAYGKIPDQLTNLELNDNIVVHIRHHHWLEDELSYHIDRIKYTKFNLGCFPAAIVSIDINW